MRKKSHEIMGVPPEFHENGAPEYPPLPDEYNRFPQPESAEAAESRSKRLRKMMLLLAAAGLAVLGIFSPITDALGGTPPGSEPEPTPTVMVAVVSTPTATHMAEATSVSTPELAPTAMAVVVSTPTATHTAEATPVSTPEPTPSVTPEPTLEPTPEPDPGVEITYYRRSEVYEAFVQWYVPEQLESATVRLTEPYMGTIWEHELDEQERASGYYWLSDFDLYNYVYTNDFSFDNVPPNYDLNPLLEVTYAYGGDGPSGTETAEAAHEMWVSVSYDSPDPEETNFYAEFFGQTIYPDCFVCRIEDWTNYDGLLISYGERELDEMAPGDVWVTVKVDGQDIPAETCQLILEPHEEENGVYYSYAFVMPRPESFPEHGTAIAMFTQKLIHYNTVSTNGRTLTY